MHPRGGPRDGSGRPVSDPSGKAQPKIFKLPPALIEALEARAAEEGVSAAQIVIRALRAYLGPPEPGQGEARGDQ